MDANVHWSIWLLSGVALGVASGLGQNGLVGMIVGVAVLASPVVIYSSVGVTLMPFALFYGGLIVATSLLFKRRRRAEDAKLRNEIEGKKRRLQG